MGTSGLLPGLLLLLTFVTDLCVASSAWTYEGKKGPNYWHQLFPQACSGRSQSPIDIKSEQTMYDPELKDFAIWHDPPRPGSTMTVLNNGHTVQVSLSGEFYVSNAGLPSVYKSAQFHFHWGHAKHHGSEHLIDGHAYPLEMHIVNYNSDRYDDIGEAVTEKEGLAVLGVMFEESEEDNLELEPIIKAMEEVTDPDDRQRVSISPLSLRDLLPEDISRYYRYSGSLTTPGCFESVVWTVFAEPKPISHRQMRKFRSMLQPDPRKAHHKRSLPDPLPLTHRGKVRERRALRVLEEMGLSEQQKHRLRRDLESIKSHADHHQPAMDQDAAAKTHHRTLGAVHEEKSHHEEEEEISEVEIEFLQERLVNNFRPVQPLNGRNVYRSFRLRPEAHGGGHGGHHGGHHEEGHQLGASSSGGDVWKENALLRERLRIYESRQHGDSGSAVPALSLALLLSCLGFLVL